MPRITRAEKAGDLDSEANLAERIGLERERRSWSTAELARRMTEAGCPTSQSAVWRIENGVPRRKISVDELLAVSKVFGQALEDLVKPVDESLNRLVNYMEEYSDIMHEVRSYHRWSELRAFVLARLLVTEPRLMQEWRGLLPKIAGSWAQPDDLEELIEDAIDRYKKGEISEPTAQQMNDYLSSEDGDYEMTLSGYMELLEG